MVKKGFIIGVVVTSICATPELLAGDQENKQGLVDVADGISFNNNEVIVALLLRKNLPLSDGVIAYVKGDDIALPFEQLMFLLEFPIKSSNKGRQASGWYIRDNQQFSLSLDSNKVVSNGKTFPLKQSDIMIVEGELYVPSRLLSQWFPIDFKANLRALDVVITPRQTIAIDERINRKKKKFGAIYQVKSTRPEQKTPYKAFTIPALSVDFGVGYYSNSDKLQSTFTIRSSSDLAFMHSDLFVTGSDRKLSDARILLSRRDPRGRLLGRLDATEIEVGDILSRSIPLIRSGVSGRGIRIARHPAEYANGLEKITLEGPIEAGYDVELYRNGILVDAIYSNPTTRYIFKDLKLFGGENEFRLEFYGKQGQRRSETKRYYVGAGLVKTGELLYDFSVYQANTSVFGVRDYFKNNKFKDNKINVHASVEYGVRPNLSFTVGMALRHENNKAVNYGFAGLRTRLGNYSLNLDAAAKDSGGSAVGISATTRFRKMDFTAKYEHYFAGFLKDAANHLGNDSYLTSTLSIDAKNDAIRIGKNSYLNCSVGLSVNEFKNGIRNYQLDNQFNLRIARTNLTNSLSYSYSPQTKVKRLFGTSNINWGFSRLGGGSFRLAVDYDIKPDRKLKTASIGINKKLSKRYSTSLNYTQDYIEDSKRLSLNISRQFKPLSLSLGVSHETYQDKREDNNGVFLTVSFNTFTDSKTLKTSFSNRQKRKLSGIRANVFLDENNNGLFDQNEKPISGAKIFGLGRNQATTNRHGQALLLGSADNAWQDIHLDTESLSDASWRAGNNGFAVLPRGGRITELNFPVVATADIEGEVQLMRADGTKKTLGNINIQAIRLNRKTGKQEVVAHTTTAYDGFYSLSGVPTGNVKLRIDPQQAKRLAVVKGTSINMNINKQKRFYSDVNLVLVR